MKKILFAAVAALAITSCSQNEEIDAPVQKTPVSFKTIVNKSARATAMLEADFSEFKVYAYNTGTDNIATATAIGTAFINGEEVTKAAEGAWGMSTTHYWPVSDNIQFFAFSPKAAISTDLWNVATKYPSFTYTIKDVASQEDLLVASATDKTKPTTDQAIELAFSHILTQINFSAKLVKNFAYTITGISIKGVNNKIPIVMTADGAHLKEPPIMLMMVIGMLLLKVMIILPTSQRQLIQNNKCPDAYASDFTFYRKNRNNIFS